MSSNNGKKKVHTFNIKDGATFEEILDVMGKGGEFLRDSPKGTSVILKFEKDDRTFIIPKDQTSEAEKTRMAVIAQIYGTPSGKGKDAIVKTAVQKKEK